MAKPPYLDNIETPHNFELASTPNNIKAFEPQNEKFKSTFEDLSKHKILSYQTFKSLLDFGDDVLHRPLAYKIYNCGSRVGFSESRLVSANFCRERICPMCQKRKSLKTYSDFCKILEKLSDFAFVHLVLTVPNCKSDELRETLSRMEKASTRFFNIAEVSTAFKGVARCTEVSYNSKTITFHPHFHCLVAVNKSYFKSRFYIKRERLQHLWSVVWRLASEYDCTDSKKLSSALRSYKDSFISDFPLRESDRLQIYVAKADEGALPEIAKYAVKPLELELTNKERASVLIALYEGLKHKRLIQTYGVIKQASAECKICFDDEEQLPSVDEKTISFYNFNYRLLQYEKGD
jgi:plasmid rolling circle replication initiator protein Rep